MTMREEVIETIDALSDEQVAELFRYIQAMLAEPMTEDETPPTKDPLIGMFSGPTNLSADYKRILLEEFGVRDTTDWNDIE